jgi:hypothetical protein
MNKSILCAVAVCIQTGCISLSAPDDTGTEAEEAAAPPGAEDQADVIEPGLSCTGEACNGRRPYGAGCLDDAVTLQTVSFPAKRGPGGKIRSGGGKVLLQVSPTCRAAWATVFRDEAYFSTAWIETRDGAGLRETIADRTRPYWQTGMFHSPGSDVRACVQAWECKRRCDQAKSRIFCTDYQTSIGGL